jgi:transposase-like protein
MPRPRRRRFTAEYKLRVLQDAEACTLRGELAELLRREGLYSSHLAAWRRARTRGELAEAAPPKRGPKPKGLLYPTEPGRSPSATEREILRLEAENARLRELCETQQRRIARLLEELRGLILGGS